MRKRYRILFLAAIVAALVVPVGYALSIEPQPVAKYARAGVVASPSASVVASPVLIRAASGSDAIADSRFPPVPDSAKLLLVGSVLLGLAAMVRKAI
jgi:hypothetical protein